MASTDNLGRAEQAVREALAAAADASEQGDRLASLLPDSAESMLFATDPAAGVIIALLSGLLGYFVARFGGSRVRVLSSGVALVGSSVLLVPYIVWLGAIASPASAGNWWAYFVVYLAILCSLTAIWVGVTLAKSARPRSRRGG